ncbi:Dicer-like protein 2 [Trapelia coarctata]|nr:Dicer-like protein 2 [Trapelia coarctata]
MIEVGSPDAVASWKQVEKEMKQMYMDDMRQLAKIQEQEEKEHGEREFVYADPKPIFSFEEVSIAPQARLIQGRVVLPKSVDVSARQAQGQAFWKSERLAKQDAAFEAYVALYRAGLVNDNLLPLVAYDEEALKAYSEVEKRPGLVFAKQQLSPWPALAVARNSGSLLHQTIISFPSQESVMPQLRLISPFRLLWTKQVTLYPNSHSSVQVEIDHQAETAYYGDVVTSENATRLLLLSIFHGRMDRDRTGFPLLFNPVLEIQDLEDWLTGASGTRPTSTLLGHSETGTAVGIIRDLCENGTPYIFHGIEYRNPRDSKYFLEQEAAAIAEVEEPFLKVKKLPKRADFLHPVPSNISMSANAKAFICLPLSTSTTDNLPFAYAQLAMFIPSIMHTVENTLVTDHLCDGLLAPVQFQDRQLVSTATTAAAACEAYNYQELEFLGDCCLKLFTSINIMSEHLNWHEGYLSHQKDHIVSNGRLALAAQETGLDQYIRTKPFTGYRWQPLYVEDLLKEKFDGLRELSTKTLADVVEALLGAAFVDGGQPKVLSCLSIFLPEVPWRPLEDCRTTLLSATTPEEYSHFPAHLEHLESLANYVFINKSLLVEAVTHPSHLGPDPTPSYDRLEFCGDSVLDFIITTRIFRHSSSLTTPRMHLLRTAVVNANFLAFTCMDHCLFVCQKSLPTNRNGTEFSNPDARIPLAIWHFMRHSHTLELMAAQEKCHARFVELQPTIAEALAHGDTFPWTLLTSFDAEKYFSDLIESIIAAIYIDSAGSLPACERFLSALGILPYLDRVLGENLHVMHPKEELGILAGNDKVTYELIEKLDESGAKTMRSGYDIRLSVGEKELLVELGARTRIEGETKAAEKAVRLLKEKRAELLESKEEEMEMPRKGEMADTGEEDFRDRNDDDETMEDEEGWATPRENMDDDENESTPTS